MIAERQQRPTGRLLDHAGRPLNSTAIQPATPVRGGLPWQPDRNAPMMAPGLVEDSRLIRPTDRRDIIRYLRFALRTDPVVASLLFRYGVAIGSPQMRSVTGVPAYDEERERYMESRFLDITTTGQDLETMNFIISVEEAIAGEVFAVFTKTGKVQLIPSELCGSPPNAPENERDGIVFASTGRPSAYRFGVRNKNGNISFREEDGARIVSAEYVHHLGQPSRVEETRFAPRLAGVLRAVEHLRLITSAKTIAVQNQAAFSLFITKNTDPALFAEMLASASTEEARNSLIEEQRARSISYGDIFSGMIYFGEPGEDIRPIAPQIDATDFGDFAFFLVEQICGPLGIRPEEVIFGYRRSSYSSARADKLGWRQQLDSIRRRRQLFLDRLQAWQSRRGAIFGELPEPPVMSKYGRPLDLVGEVRWSWPALIAVDEAKDAASKAMRLANKTASRSGIVAEEGQWGEQVDREIVSEAARMARLLKVQADPTLRNMPLEEVPVTVEEIRAQMVDAAQSAAASASLAAAMQTQPEDTPPANP